jgi:signal peptidase I
MWRTYRKWKADRQLRRDAVALEKEARRVRRRYAHRMSEAQKKDLDARSLALDSALREKTPLQPPMEKLHALLDGPLAFAKKSQARQYVESIGAVVFVALVLRSFVVEAYQIPSGSMIPTLSVGDRIWVNKLIYGVRLPFSDIKFGVHYREPRRGEIIVFSHPKEPDKDLIKRVVGVGGDRIELRDDTVYVNGVPCPRDHEGAREYWDFSEFENQWQHRRGDAWNESLGAAHFTTLYDPAMGNPNYPETTVPPGSLFVMGDNRDNSADSRTGFFVPLNLVRGRAMVVWWSSGGPEGIRWSRFGHLIQ